MENGLRKSGLSIGIGLLSLLMLPGIGSSYAKTSFKNTPLYKHIVGRRNTEPVKLYEAQPATVVAKQPKEQPVENKPTYEQFNRNRIEQARTFFRPRRSTASLADPSTFTPQMPLREAVDILRKSIPGGLNIVVLWKDLEENADIYPDTSIGIDGVSGVSLGRHLRSLLDGVSGASPERLGYVVEEGVVIVATIGSLPQKMVTRVYDVTDLVAPPSTGMPRMGFGMGMMGGMMPGMGMQGGMMPGMGGMMGGMMPGFGGGGFGGGGGYGGFGGFGGSYGNFGGGYGNFGGGYGGFGGGYNSGVSGLTNILNAPYRSR